MGGLRRMATYPGNPPAGPSQVQRVDRPVKLQELVGVGVAFKRPHYYEAFNAIGSRPDLNAVKLTARVNPRMGLVLTGWMQGRIKLNSATASPQAFYVFGVDRGGQTIAPFPGRPGVKFNAVVAVAVTSSGISGSVIDLATGACTNLSAQSIQIRGNKVKVTVPLGLLPVPAGSTSSLRDYGVNLWPRSALPPADFTTVASFVPENSMLRIAVPSGFRG